jgi:hypothetical protein
MLRLSNNQHQLDIQSQYGRAWIEHYPRLSGELQRLGEIPDWRLWLHEPGKAPSLSKSPTRLLIESQLRAWVLRQSKRCLVTLSFNELKRLAQGRKTPAPETLMHRRNHHEPEPWEGSFGPVRRRR